MKKLWMVGFFLTLSGCNGCATTHPAKLFVYQKALADTNTDLTQARVENKGLREQVRRLATAWYNCKRGKGCTIKQ